MEDKTITESIEAMDKALDEIRILLDMRTMKEERISKARKEHDTLSKELFENE